MQCSIRICIVSKVKSGQVECRLETGALWFHPQPAGVEEGSAVRASQSCLHDLFFFSFFFLFLVYTDLKSYLKQVIQQPSGLLNSFFSPNSINTVFSVEGKRKILMTAAGEECVKGTDVTVK